MFATTFVHHLPIVYSRFSDRCIQSWVPACMHSVLCLLDIFSILCFMTTAALSTQQMMVSQCFFCVGV